MEKSVYTSSELRSYLRKRRSEKNRTGIPEFEEFLRSMSSIFALRISAEEYWAGSPRASPFNHKEHKYYAENQREALPLEWDEIRKILLPERDEPPLTLVTYIAAHCVEEVRIISSGMRRILSRERVSTPVGKVQQLDTYCMRWLMRQPGRDFAEKGGTRQRVMAVVRREQFDTLENRVFKDFLIRAENLADSYLNEISSKFSGHQTYESVRAFKIACQGALALPEMGFISGLVTIPQPNYVLQQDNRYSKIWTAYCKIMRFTNLAEKYWGHRDGIKRKLWELTEECRWQVEHGERTRFHTQIWFQKLDGSANLIESACIDHTLAGEFEIERRKIEKQFTKPENGVAVVDLSGNHLFGSALITGGYHPNSRIRISSDWYPILDDELAIREKKGEKIWLSSIVSTVNNAKLQDDRREKYAVAVKHIVDYCARLYGELRNLDRTLDEIVVLSPDDWNAVTQEVVIRSFPMLERRNIHLLWRSVAMVLGMRNEITACIKENEVVAVVDFRNDGVAMVTGLKYLRDDESGQLIPQRSVYLKNGKPNAGRYASLKALNSHAQILGSTPVNEAKVLCLCGCVPTSFKNFLDREYSFLEIMRNRKVRRGQISCGNRSWIVLEDGSNSWGLREGALLFSREHNTHTLYFDELEAMWVVGQFNEKIVKTALVKENERFKGGTTKEFEIPSGLLQIGEGQRGVEFLFHIGQLQEWTLLHSYKESLPDLETRRSIKISGTVSVSPGQGIAVTTVFANALKSPIILDYLQNMTLSTWSIQKLEEELPRSFPPTCAVVEAYPQSCYGTQGFWGTRWGRFGFLDKVRTVVLDYMSHKIPLSQIPDDAFAHALRKTESDLEYGESRLHLLDRRNIFGNIAGSERPFWLSKEQENLLIERLTSDMRRSNATREKCLRLLAWMYRGGNSSLKNLTKIICTEYERCRDTKASVPAVEVSFLANYLTDKRLVKYEKIVADVLFARFALGLANGNDLRMFYNLLQFDSDFFEKVEWDLSKCITMTECLIRDMKRNRNEVRPSNYKACIRVFLYFLRRRERERHFLRSAEMYKAVADIPKFRCAKMAVLYEEALNELRSKIIWETDDTRMLRKSACKFLQGNGTLADIVNVTEVD